MRTVDIKGKCFICRYAGKQNSDCIRNGQTHFGQYISSFLFDIPVYPGTNDIGIRHCCAL